MTLLRDRETVSHIDDAHVPVANIFPLAIEKHSNFRASVAAV
jgi:hypothetical protein